MITDEEFEEIVVKNEKLIYYHIRSLHIVDYSGEFFAVGLEALWQACLTYKPELGKFSSYISWKIRNRLIDQIRKSAKTKDVESAFIREHIHLKLYQIENSIHDDYFWEQVRLELTENQWKWVYYYIIHDLSVEQIAKLEGVTRDAVKNWGRRARDKLSSIPALHDIVSL
ncbi:sigma-70 family RNA polymerase sigma factor [Halobacillus salinarum]|uniref:Sigma-70 family RNA polymerase sigma factor n=1 Tax=Halobacillus salinarum TaxID=2932257 RepID=A0ABY4EMJ1_9BACI|nr:sigma-70 family RNA polymerase sigma factor [Halobacillus salinarum]UOQ45670.1 sigma-70 family RNA polymerase sigma factor [Halobacillus salinarum]